MESKTIKRADLLSLADYERRRGEIVPRIIGLKALRRVEVGPWMSLVFENRETVLYQIQEMLRIERITDPAAVDHEIETYAELLPGPGELSATLFIEIPDAEQRHAALRKLGGVEKSVSLKVGRSASAAYDKRPIDPRFERPGHATAVYYLGFKLSAAQRQGLPSADLWVEVAHPQYRHAAALTEQTRASLAADLA